MYEKVVFVIFIKMKFLILKWNNINIYIFWKVFVTGSTYSWPMIVKIKASQELPCAHFMKSCKVARFKLSNKIHKKILMKNFKLKLENEKMKIK